MGNATNNSLWKCALSNKTTHQKKNGLLLNTYVVVGRCFLLKSDEDGLLRYMLRIVTFLN